MVPELLCLQASKVTLHSARLRLCNHLGLSYSSSCDLPNHRSRVASCGNSGSVCRVGRWVGKPMNCLIELGRATDQPLRPAQAPDLAERFCMVRMKIQIELESVGSNDAMCMELGVIVP
jgi:hypothetical protein